MEAISALFRQCQKFCVLGRFLQCFLIGSICASVAFFDASKVPPKPRVLGARSPHIVSSFLVDLILFLRRVNAAYFP